MIWTTYSQVLWNGSMAGSEINFFVTIQDKNEWTIKDDIQQKMFGMVSNTSTQCLLLW